MTSGKDTVASNQDQTLDQGLEVRLRHHSKNRDLHAVLGEDPEVCQKRSLIISLAVDDYESRIAAGESIDIQEYCRQFLKYGRSIYSSVFRQIEFEEFLIDHPDFDLLQKPDRWPEPGDTVSEFTVIEELGRGALARVYLCSQSDLGDRQVVVKVSGRGEQEAATLGRVQHPNIMPVHSIEIEDDLSQTYLCTPFLGRSTLADLVVSAFADAGPRSINTLYRAANKWNQSSDKVTPLRSPVRKLQKGSYVDGVIDITIKLASALQHAHESGILHGDLKPSNVLLTSELEPILLDFNLSPSVGIEARGGTIPYMAPEQVLSLTDFDREYEYDHKSEVFSLGVMLYELLSGQLPFESVRIDSIAELTPSDLQAKHKNIAPIASCEIQPGSSLFAIIERCLAFSPELRFDSMGQLREALLQEKQVKKRLRRGYQYHRKSVLTGASLLGLSLGALATWMLCRPPYHDRQYAHGIAMYRQGDYQEAFHHFERALADGGSLDSQYAAAQSALQAGDTEQATDLFIDLALHKKHPPSMASTAYCLNLKKSHTSAIPWYRRAIDAGYAPASVYNNLSLSYDLGRSTHSEAERLDLGIECAKTALRLSPKIAAAHLNLAHLAIKRHLNDGEYPVDEGIEHINEFIKAHRGLKEAYILAAYLYGAKAQQDSTAIEAAIKLLIEGCDLQVGITLKSILESPFGHSFRSHPGYPALKHAIDHQNASRYMPRFSRLVDPANL